MKYYGEDPRILSIPKRLARVGRIIAFVSSKGGVGKTTISTLTALSLAYMGYKTGLLDLDLVNPATHIVLGVDPSKTPFVEERGIVPPQIHGIRYMSIVLFTKGSLSPLRGDDINEAFAEILSITNWGDLDYLVIDTPPGFSDEHLDLINYIKKLEVVLVSTPSSLSIRSAEYLLNILGEHEVHVTGLIENMSSSDSLRDFCLSRGIRYLGSVPYDTDLERGIGSVDAVKKTRVWSAVMSIAENIHGQQIF